jgi:hypothetical protein
MPSVHSAGCDRSPWLAGGVVEQASRRANTFSSFSGMRQESMVSGWGRRTGQPESKYLQYLDRVYAGNVKRQWAPAEGHAIGHTHARFKFQVEQRRETQWHPRVKFLSKHAHCTLASAMATRT